MSTPEEQLRFECFGEKDSETRLRWCAEEKLQMYWPNKYGATRQEEKRETTEMIHGCSERGHVED